MTSVQDSNKAVVVRFNKEYIEAGDFSVFEQTVAADFVNHSAHPGVPGDRAGARYFFDQVLRPAFGELTVTVHDQVAEGDKVVTRKTYRGVHRDQFQGVAATGRSIEFNVVDILRLVDGRYVEHWAIADMAGLRRQLTA